jgi:hypothetical protein
MELVLSGREVSEDSKLHGMQNYALWTFKLKTILQGKKLWRIVDPEPSSGASSSSIRASSSTHPIQSNTATGLTESTATTRGATML